MKYYVWVKDTFTGEGQTDYNDKASAAGERQDSLITTTSFLLQINPHE
jgi:hypothetical protein